MVLLTQSPNVDLTISVSSKRLRTQCKDCMSPALEKGFGKQPHHYRHGNRARFYDRETQFHFACLEKKISLNLCLAELYVKI